MPTLLNSELVGLGKTFCKKFIGNPLTANQIPPQMYFLKIRSRIQN